MLEIGSPLDTIQHLNLRINMRAYLPGNTHSNFPQQLLKLCERILPCPNVSSSYDVLLDEFLGQIVNNLKILIDAVYPDIENLHKKCVLRWLCSRAIVPHKMTYGQRNKQFDYTKSPRSGQI